MGVAPNSTFGYIWKLTRDDGPLKDDPECLTQLYRSMVVPEKDLASGLVGTLLVCKNEAIDGAGRLVRRAFMRAYMQQHNKISLQSTDIPLGCWEATEKKINLLTNAAAIKLNIIPNVSSVSSLLDLLTHAVWVR